MKFMESAFAGFTYPPQAPQLTTATLLLLLYQLYSTSYFKNQLTATAFYPTYFSSLSTDSQAQLNCSLQGITTPSPI